HTMDERHRSLRLHTKAYYEQSLQLNPNGEVAWSLATMLDEAYQPFPSDEILKILDQHQESLAVSPMYHRARGRLLLKLNRFSEALSAYHRSLSIQFDDKRRFETAKELAWDYWITQKSDFDRATTLLEPFANSVDHDAVRDAQLALAEISGCRLDIDQAQFWLHEAAKSKNINSMYVPDRLKELDHLRDVLRRRDDYFAERPYHLAWLNRFGLEGLVIPFDRDSEKLTKQAEAKLDVIRALIPPDQWNTVVFTVMGNRSPQEAPGIRLKRAQAVGDDLISRLSLQPSQIQIRENPAPVTIRSGDSSYAAARKQIVEIHISGNLSSPTLAVATGMPNDFRTTSSDGRLGILEKEVWDLQQQVRLFGLGDNKYEGVSPDFSPNSLWIATLFSSNAAQAIVISDTNTGVPLLVHACPLYFAHDTKWSPDGTALAIGSHRVKSEAGLPGVVVLNAVDGVLRGSSYSDNSATDRIAWLAGGAMIALQPWAANRIPIVSTESWKRIKELDDVQWARSIGTTSDGNKLLLGDDKRNLHIYDVDDDFSHTEANLDCAVDGYIDVHPGKPLIMLNNVWGTRPEIRVFDFEKLSEVAAWKYEGSLKSDEKLVTARWINNGTQILIENDEVGYQLFSPSLDRQTPFSTLASKLRTEATFSELGILVTIDDEGMHVWNIETGRKIHHWKGENYKYLGALSDGNSFLAANADQPTKSTTIIRFDLKELKQHRLRELGVFEIQKHCIRESVAVLAGTVYSNKGDTIEHGTVQVVSLNDGATVSEFQIPMTTASIRIKLHRSRFGVLAVNDAATQAILRTEWEDGLGWGMTREHQLRFLDLTTGTLKDSKTEFQDPPLAAFFEGEEQYRISTSVHQKDAVYWLADEKFHSRSPISERTSLQERGYDENLDDALVKFNLKVKVRSTNEIEFYRRDTDLLVLTILVRTDGKWLAVTPSGEFSASLEGDENVFWRVGSNFLPLDTLRAKFERPDLVVSHLQAIAAGETATSDTSIEASLFGLPYQVRLTSVGDVETNEDQYELILEVDLQFEDTPDPTLEFLHNGRVIPQDRGQLKLVKRDAARTTT
ncbi:MAG: WD40 repeat domain-containing protein, partial [Planctomycetota bacterium]|nr:WD40 repeat domain-containing protein [Planctomycetota bacterium]